MKDEDYRAHRLRPRLCKRAQVEGKEPFHAEPVLHELEDLWVLADSGPRVPSMSTADVDAAKARRRW